MWKEIAKTFREFTVWDYAILGVALFLRVFLLHIKPVHFDEGINGWFVNLMYERGYYPYDPSNYHGPLHFYLLQLFKTVFGSNITSFRLCSALASFLGVFVVLMHKNYLKGARFAALILAVSTGFVFYARYSIHESLLFLGISLFSYGFFSLYEKRIEIAYSFLALGALISITTKETFFIFIANFFLAHLAVNISRKFVSTDRKLKLTWSWEEAVVPFTWAIFVWALLFTGFFQNPNGIQSFFATFAKWSQTGTGHSGHEKSFFYWFELLFRYEWVLCIAFIAAVISLFQKKAYLRFLAFYSLGTFIAFSIIPYKTPWCIITIMWSFAFILGYYLETAAKNTFILSVALIVGCMYPCLRMNFKDYAKIDEPYVYVQSTSDFQNIMNTLRAEGEKYPSFYNQELWVALDSQWPMPWILEDFTHITYYPGKSYPPKLTAPIILIDSAQLASYSAEDLSPYLQKRFILRGSQQESALLVQRGQNQRLINALGVQ